MKDVTTAMLMNKPGRPVTPTSGCHLRFWDISDPPPIDSEDTWDASLQDVKKLRELRDDWDGEGAKSPSPELLSSAELLLPIIQEIGVAPPRVAAGPNGTILLAWYNGPHYFEINVVQPGKLRWMMMLHNSRAEHGSELNRRLVEMLKLTLSM